MTILDRLRQDKFNIIKKYESGDSTVVLGKYYKCDARLIWKILDENNVEIRRRSKTYGNMNQYKEQICKLFEENNSCNKIANLLNLLPSAVTSNLCKWGYDTSRHRTRKDGDLISNYKEEVVSLYKRGLSRNEIGKKLGFTGKNIFENLVKWGYAEYGKKYKYDVKTDFFKNGIDTQEKAYFLGFFYGDGNMSDKGVIKISLQDRDEHILQEFKQLLGYTGPLYDIKTKGNRYPKKSLTISRQELSQHLVRLGCVPRKTFKIRLPTEDIVPKHLIWHFIRGLSDSDGSLRINYFTIASCYGMTYDLANFLDGLGIEYKIYQRTKHETPETSCYSLFVYKKASRIKYYNLLYKDSTIHLNRKYEKALEIYGPLNGVL